MRTHEIVIGGVYHDGKQGVREVIHVSAARTRVEYKILAAKMATQIGTVTSCELRGFCQWAKTHVADRNTLLADLAAKKIKLPPGEKAFMESVASEFGSDVTPKAGCAVSYSFNETRSAHGVEKKGLLTVQSGQPRAGGDVILTELGAAWIRLHQSENKE